MQKLAKKRPGVAGGLCVCMAFFFLLLAPGVWAAGNNNTVFFNSSTLLVANWNLQAFGVAKARNSSLMDFYANTIRPYDIIFIDEIRDANGTAFGELCRRLADFNCLNSSRAGRSVSKEQIGVIYRHGIGISGWKDFNPDSKDRWERPPLQVDFNASNYTIRFYAMHAKPGAVPAELRALEKAVNNSGRVGVVGDLNADCSYYPPLARTQFLSWKWAIPTGTDTTVSPNTFCTYDRVLLNWAASRDFAGYGVARNGIKPGVSDHYLVWVKLNLPKKR